MGGSEALHEENVTIVYRYGLNNLGVLSGGGRMEAGLKVAGSGIMKPNQGRPLPH